MPQPTPYVRQADFTTLAALDPTAPLPGASVDAELNAILVTLQGCLASLLKLQRDDGALKNGLVTLDALSPSVLTAIGAGTSWQGRGAWVTATAYAAKDIVVDGTRTYLAATAHVSSADIATDIAAGKWVLLFDTAGTVPADDSVTADKIADGAILAAAIGFNDLTLSGFVKSGRYLVGTANDASLFKVAQTVGDVVVKVQRATTGQGEVGLEIIGATTFKIVQPSGLDELAIYAGAVKRARLDDNGVFDVVGTVRAQAAAFPASGAGAGLNYVAGTCYLTAYNYDASTHIDLKVRGKDIYLVAGGVDVMKATSAAVDFLKPVKQNGNALGYLGLPQDAKNTSFTLAMANAGGHVYSENVAGQTVTVPTNAAVAFSIDTGIVIINDGSNPINVLPADGVSLRQTGTATVKTGTASGGFNLAAGGRCTLIKVKANRWFIDGIGLTP